MSLPAREDRLGHDDPGELGAWDVDLVRRHALALVRGGVVRWEALPPSWRALLGEEAQ